MSDELTKNYLELTRVRQERAKLLKQLDRGKQQSLTVVYHDFCEFLVYTIWYTRNLESDDPPTSQDIDELMHELMQTYKGE